MRTAATTHETLAADLAAVALLTRAKNDPDVLALPPQVWAIVYRAIGHIDAAISAYLRGAR